MEAIITTERLILRKIGQQDLEDLFEMDADPDVHKFIENKPVKSHDEIVKVIELINQQYEENGVGRWAVVDKITHECLGWAGLKYFRQNLNNHINFYELGYRFKKKHWGKGYATESGKAIIRYGFSVLNAESLFAITHPENQDSVKVLRKLGFDLIEQFDYEGDLTNWFELTKTNWQQS